MIDSAAEDLAHRILVAFPPSTARTRADIQRVPVPVGRLLGAELDAHADRYASLPTTEWVDRDDERLSEARGAWRQAVRAAAHFPADVWEEAVAQAARLAVSHLVRPAETAAADAFADADGLAELPIGAALARVRIFGAYGYLPEIAARYAERKGVAAIDRAGLERLLRRIDRRMVEDFGPDEWTALAGPLYDLIGSVSTPRGTVGVGLLRALFEAKGRHEIARTLISDTYTHEALHAHLVAVMPRTDAAPAEPASPEPASPELTPPEPAPAAPEASASPPDPLTPELPHAPELERQARAEPSAPAEPDWAEPDSEEPDSEEPDPSGVADVPPTETPELPGAEPPPSLPDEAVASPTAEAALRYGTPEEATDPTHTDAGPSGTNAPAEASSAEASSAEASSTETTLPGGEDTSAEPADAEPLWKRMLQRPDAERPSERPLAATADPDVPAEPEPPAPPADATEAADEPEPLWRRFAAPEPVAQPDDEDGWAVAPTLAATPTAVLPDAPLPPPRTLADAFARPDALPPAEAASGEAARPSPDARASLDAVERTVLGPGPDDRREWFVNTLFEASAEDYEATLRALAEAASWTAATQIIASEVFRKHRVNIYSEAAIAFTDAVETQIHART